MIGITSAATGQTFTSSGSYTVPPGVTSLNVDVYGGDGGGGLSLGTLFGYQGGGGGSADGIISVQPGTNCSVTVGTGGGVAGGGGYSEVNCGGKIIGAGGGGGGSSYNSSGSDGGGGIYGGKGGIYTPLVTGSGGIGGGGSLEDSGSCSSATYYASNETSCCFELGGIMKAGICDFADNGDDYSYYCEGQNIVLAINGKRSGVIDTCGSTEYCSDDGVVAECIYDRDLGEFSYCQGNTLYVTKGGKTIYYTDCGYVNRCEEQGLDASCVDYIC